MQNLEVFSSRKAIAVEYGYKKISILENGNFRLGRGVGEFCLIRSGRTIGDVLI